jgi:hypothetical protein
VNPVEAVMPTARTIAFEAVAISDKIGWRLPDRVF